MEQSVSLVLAAAAVGGFAVTAVTCWLLIPALHRLHFGQTIREEGPTWHNKKNGTPTMGGLGFIFGILVALGAVWLLFRARMPEVLGPQQLAAGMMVLFLAFGSGVIGFLDDFIKVVRHRNLGLTAPQKIVLQVAVTVGFMIGLHSLGLLSTVVMFPVAGACAGFLIWNFYPAKVFMGDTGSMFFGGLVTALAFIMDRPELVLFFGLVYIWDALTVVIQRVYFKLTHGKRIFKMTPIHHAFEMRGWREVKIDGFFALIAAVGVSLGILYICLV